MSVVYEIIKGVFFALTLVVGLFYLRWAFFLEGEVYNQAQQLLMPWYMLFCGLMMGYLIAHVWIANREKDMPTTGVYIKSFMIGIILGLGLSLSYMFV